jgi:hypothetical protein
MLASGPTVTRQMAKRKRGWPRGYEVVVQVLRSFDDVFDHLTLDEKRDLLRLMLKRVVVSKYEVEMELYEGRRASAMLAAFAVGRGSQNNKLPVVLTRSS